jgi:hypothetical protein
MPEVISSVSEASGRGVFIIFKAVLAAVAAVGTGRAVMVAQLPWGPLDTEEAFGNAASFREMFCPDGFARTSQGYLMATKFPWVDLRIVRVAGTTPVKATINLANITPVTCIRIDGKYFGAAGTGITVVVTAATNGTATSYNITFAKTDPATGLNTTETYPDVDGTQTTQAYLDGVFGDSKIVSVVYVAAGRPVNVSTALAGGSDGAAIASLNYLGTPGSGTTGVSVLENDPDVSFVFTDDPGAGILAAVMAGLKAHVQLMKDRRIAILMGLPGETKATAITNVALNRDNHCVYVYPHAYVPDDSGTSTLIPLTGPLAAFATLLTPHLSIGYKNASFTKAFAAITGLDMATTIKQTRIDLEEAGVVAFERNSASGHYSPYCDTTTGADRVPVYAVRMADYIAFSVAEALEPYRSGPNYIEQQEDERTLLREFLRELKANAGIDVIFRPSIEDFEVIPIEASNTTTQLDAGDFTIDFRVALIPEQKRIFLRGEIGTTVVVTPSAA